MKKQLTSYFLIFGMILLLTACSAVPAQTDLSTDPPTSTTSAPPSAAGAFEKMLEQAGLEADNVSYIEYRTQYNGGERTVFVTTTTSGDLALVQASVDAEGVWQIISTESTDTKAGKNRFTDAWMNSGRIGMFSSASSAMPTQWNYVYCGTDAKGRIEISQEDIPGNITVNIQQYGERYLIHVISYADIDTVNNFDVWNILLENDCIKE